MNYYEFRLGMQTCSHCQWKGLGRDAPILETLVQLAEYACPRCGEKIAVVMYPTIAESRANWQYLEPEERKHLEAVEASRKDFADRCLTTPDQLPDIPNTSFVLYWDDDGQDWQGGDTVIRFGDLVVWQERCVFQGYWRFMEIVAILNARYGAALQDLEPTIRAELWLYGDSYTASDTVMNLRNKLRTGATVPLEPLNSSNARK